MATLGLTQLWVNLVATGQAVTGQTWISPEEGYAVPGAVRTYAGGRRRAIRQAGQLGTFKFRLAQIDQTAVDTLKAWAGQAVQVRDHRGRRFFGTYFTVAITPRRGSLLWNAEITLENLTVAEGV